MKSERGASHLVAVLAVVLVVVVAGAGYYVWQKRSGGDVSLPLVGQSYKCEYEDKDLCKFLGNMAGSTKYSVTSTSSQGDQKYDFKVVVDGADKSETVMSLNGKENSHVITIKDATYTKDFSDNKWWKEVAKPSKDDPKDDVVFNTDKSKDESKQETQKTEYKKVGKEACGKLSCFKYQVIYPGMEGTEFIWFDDKQYLIRKHVTTDNQGYSMTAEYSYDKVSVKEPSPVKEGSPTPAVNGAAVPSQQDLQNMQIPEDTSTE